MEQLAIRNLCEPVVYGRFTFALRTYIDNSGWKKSRDVYGLCLVFGPPHDGTPNGLSHLNMIMNIPFVRELAAPGPIWFAQHKYQTIVSNNLSLVPRASKGEADTGVGLLTYEEGRWQKQVWPYWQLYKNCYNLEKFGSQCNRCEHEGSDCIRSCIESQAHEEGIEIHLPESTDELMFFEELDDDREIPKLLKRVSKGTPWEYVAPKNTVDKAFAPRLLGIRDMSFKYVDDNRAVRSERSKRAARTRKALVRCKECWFQDQCVWCSPPYFGFPYQCQTEGHDPYGALRVPGPYSKKQAYAAAEKFWHSLPHIDRKKVECIAYNAGISTYIFGYELKLGRMSKEMDNVEFFRPGNGDRRCVDFEEAVILCNTPYRSNKKYYYPTRGNSYNEQRWCEPEERMSDEIFYTFIEMCQHDWLSSRRYKQPHQLAVFSAEWDGHGTISSETDYHYGLSVSDLRGIMHYQEGFPKTVRSFMRSKEEVETHRRETSSGTQS